MKIWIIATPDDAITLSKLGICLGLYDDAEREYRGCEVDEETLVKLDPYWGQYIWGSEPHA